MKLLCLKEHNKDTNIGKQDLNRLNIGLIVTWSNFPLTFSHHRNAQYLQAQFSRSFSEHGLRGRIATAKKSPAQLRFYQIFKRDGSRDSSLSYKVFQSQGRNQVHFTEERRIKASHLCAGYMGKGSRSDS